MFSSRAKKATSPRKGAEDKEEKGFCLEAFNDGSFLEISNQIKLFLPTFLAKSIFQKMGLVGGEVKSPAKFVFSEKAWGGGGRVHVALDL